jgi:hypothetical protein
MYQEELNKTFEYSKRRVLHLIKLMTEKNDEITELENNNTNNNDLKNLHINYNNIKQKIDKILDKMSNEINC